MTINKQISVIFIGALFGAVSGCASTPMKNSTSIKPVTDVKYFHVPSLKPVAGVDYILLTAKIEGRLNIKNHCLRIGKDIPIFDDKLTIAQDRRGLFVQHNNGGRRYRLGDKISGGGGSTSAESLNANHLVSTGAARNGASVTACRPEPRRDYGETHPGYYVSFWLPDPLDQH